MRFDLSQRHDTTNANNNNLTRYSKNYAPYEEEQEADGGEFDDVLMTVPPSSSLSGSRDVQAMINQWLPWMHGILLIVLTALVASSSSYKALEGWLITPTRCTLWVDGACVPKSSVVPFDNPALLSGQIIEYESRGTGLFSAVHAPFLCMATQVLCCALSLKIAFMDENATSMQILKHLSIFLIAAYAVLYLLMQTHWHIPLDNLFLVELLFMLALFFVGTYSVRLSPQSAGAVVTLVNAVLTYPLLAVAVLGAVGEDDVLAHWSVFFGLILGCLVFLAMALDTATSKDTNLTGIYLVTYWLCIIPFIVRCCIRLHEVDNLATWALAALILLLVFYLSMAVLLTLRLQQMWLSFWAVDTSVFFRFFDFVIKATLSLLLVLGTYA